MAKKERNRSRGGIEYDIVKVPTATASQTYTVWVKWDWDQSTNFSNLRYTRQLIPALGLDFSSEDLDTPNVKYNGSGYAYFEQTQEYRDYLHSWISSRISYSGSSQGTSVAFVKGDTSQLMTDVVGSGYPSKKGKEFVVNPMFQRKTTFVGPVSDSGDPEITVTVFNGSNSLRYCYFQIQVIVKPPGTPVGIPQSLYLNLQNSIAGANAELARPAFTKAYAKVQSAELELLTVLGESSKTLNYLYKRLSSLANLLSSVKNAMRKLDWNAAADYWLEARYSIRPIIYDVHGAIAALSKDELSLVQTFKSYDTDTSTESLYLTHSADGLDYTLDCDITTFDQMSAGVYGRLRFDMPNAHAFGVFNFAQTAWELIPYSFVIDWFINVSGFIAGINPNPIYMVETGWIGHQRRSVVAGTITTKLTGAPADTAKSENFFLTRLDYQRAIATEPSLVNFDLNLSVPKLVDLLALARRFL